MNRQHTREEYMALIDTIRELIPECGISHDMIAGFPSETEQDHQDTLDLMDYVQYDFGFMFAYSERPGTLAARKIKDDVADEIKKKRLSQIIEKQQSHSKIRTQAFLGQTVCVLIEKESKRSQAHWSGRTTQNTVVVFPKKEFNVGDFVEVNITDCTSATLIGEAIERSKRV